MTARIGTMRHRLTLEQPSHAADGAGGVDVTWTHVADVWAALRPVSADEIADGDGEASRVTHEVVLRHRANITTAMRLTKGPRVFAIRSVMDPIETRVWTQCRVEEQQA